MLRGLKVSGTAGGPGPGRSTDSPKCKIREITNEHLHNFFLTHIFNNKKYYNIKKQNNYLKAATS